LEQKWRTLDQFEASLRKLEAHKLQWKAKYAIKEGELEAAKVSHIPSLASPISVPITLLLDNLVKIEPNVQSRTTDLTRQLTSTTSSHSINDNAQIKTLTDRALSAEKRANHASNQLAMLEAKLADMQSKSGRAEDKWEARVREYENRLRIAGEKIKTEKQGGKERALQLEGQVRYVYSILFPGILFLPD